ncbi:hypothetical protein ACQQ2N_02915 [Dokdonella sp. MW10]|uniref:hypothetical protein n=1 Tax=Dokdonella sp. MW10 TaxID=2992926 RepID=UPI003F816C1A
MSIATVPEAQPVWLGDDTRATFAWLHRPAVAGDTALVIVPPFGYEAICAHRTLRRLAELAAESGLLALRVDPDGTGDSAGDDLDDARIDAWVASVGKGCDRARAEGATRLVLAGLRLGAAWAVLAARLRDDVVGLVAIAPVVQGKRFLRESRMLQRALGLPLAAPREGEPLGELIGFAITPDTHAALERLDLAALPAPAPAPDVLVLERADLAASTAWPVQLGVLGAHVEQRVFDGYTEMMLDPHRSTVPERLLDAVVAFARKGMTVHDERSAHDGAPVCRESTGARIDALREAPVTLASGARGVATLPAATPRAALVLLNAGATPRIGPNRLHVRLARQLASRGTLVLRIDLRGLGDSPPADGVEAGTVYPGVAATADVAAAVAMARGLGAPHVTVAGVCAGAFHALQAAFDGTPFDAVIAINPLTFRPIAGMPPPLPVARVIGEAARYRALLRTWSGWRKLLRGRVDVVAALRVVARRASMLARARGVGLLRLLHVPMRHDLAGDLRALVRRGVRVDFLFAEGDPGHDLLSEQGGRMVAALVARGAIGVALFEGSDHTFTPRASQDALVAAMVGLVEPRSDDAR